MGALYALDLTRSKLVDELGLFFRSGEDVVCVLGLKSEESRKDGRSDVAGSSQKEDSLFNLS